MQTKKSNLTVCATGDSLFVAKMPREYDEDLAAVKDFLGTGDVRMTNFESNIMDYGNYAAAESGGTWLTTPLADFEDITRFDFNYYGTANNHTLDYSYHGLLSTLDALDARGLAHSGSGRSLEEAVAPAVLDVNGQRVAIVAFCVVTKDSMKAGEGTPAIAPRPGVNYVRTQEYLSVTPEEEAFLRGIAEKTHVNDYFNIMVETGFSKPTPKGLFKFGSLTFCSDGSKPSSVCVAVDKARILGAVREAKKSCDAVLVLSHSHGMGKDRLCDVPEYLKEISRDCIDAGACAVIGGGTHELCPMEMYHGAPIFYSLGDFIYQGMQVHYLPADFLRAQGLEPDASAWEGLMARSQNGRIGLQAQRCNFLTVLPRMGFEDGRLSSLEMLPVSLGFEKEGDMKGLPCVAHGEEAREICEILDSLSRPYGVTLKLREDGMIVLA